MGKLTIKQEKFVNKYMQCGSASEAYRFAYDCKNMKSTTINKTAFELIKNPKIAAIIKERQQKSASRVNISKEKILKELALIGFYDLKDYVNVEGNEQGGGVVITPFDKLTKEQLVAIKEVKEGRGGIELKMYDKLVALERICKMLGYDAPEKKDIKFDEETAKVITGMQIK